MGVKKLSREMGYLLRCCAGVKKMRLPRTGQLSWWGWWGFIRDERCWGGIDVGKGLQWIG